jgi:hypothetical protein
MPVWPASVMNLLVGRMGVIATWLYVGGGVATVGGLNAWGLFEGEELAITVLILSVDCNQGPGSCCSGGVQNAGSCKYDLVGFCYLI